MSSRSKALVVLLALLSLAYLIDYWLVTWLHDELPMSEIANSFFKGGSQANRLLWGSNSHALLGVTFNIGMLVTPFVVVGVLLSSGRRKSGEVAGRRVDTLAESTDPRDSA